MGKITLKNNQQNKTTTIPNIFLDKHMPTANGEFVKVYLYLLRCSQSSSLDLSISDIADTFNHTEKDVIRALKYWEQAGLLSLSYNEYNSIAGIDIKNIISDEDVSNTLSTPIVTAAPMISFATSISPEIHSQHMDNLIAAPTVEPVNVTNIKESTNYQAANIAPKRIYTPSEVNTLIADDDVASLLYIAEKFFARPLSSADTNILLYIYDELKFSPELIEYLIEYCVSHHKTSARYLESVAVAWASKNITTVDEAKRSSSLYTKEYFSVLKAFGISGRDPGNVEKTFIDRWLKEYGFSTEIILEACNRTLSTIHKPSFQYADGILSRWKDAGIKRLDDIKGLDVEHEKNKAAHEKADKQPVTKNAFNNFDQRDYNYDQLEKDLLTSNHA